MKSFFGRVWGMCNLGVLSSMVLVLHLFLLPLRQTFWRTKSWLFALSFWQLRLLLQLTRLCMGLLPDDHLLLFAGAPVRFPASSRFLTHGSSHLCTDKLLRIFWWEMRDVISWACVFSNLQGSSQKQMSSICVSEPHRAWGLGFLLKCVILMSTCNGLNLVA